MTSVGLEITGTGWLTTFTDLGRRDAERLGVPAGGAADQHSAVVANLLAGNPRNATVLENLGSGLSFVPDHDILLAVTGAPCRLTVGKAPVDTWTPVVAPKGHEVRIDDVHRGTRTYLAVHGQLAAPTFLGSAAPDARMGFGQVITPGTRIALDTDFLGFQHNGLGQPVFRLPVPILSFAPGPWSIDVVETPGAHSISGIRALIEQSPYTVTAQSNHVGLRLAGPVLHPATDTEIVSHGVPIGALEIPHADELIVLGRYRSLTAGYPIVGVAARACLPLLGQAGPGQELRFRWIDRERSARRFARHEDELRALERAAAMAFDALGLVGALASTDMRM